MGHPSHYATEPLGCYYQFAVCIIKAEHVDVVMTTANSGNYEFQELPHFQAQNESKHLPKHF